MCDALDLLHKLECASGVKVNFCPTEITDTLLPGNSTVNILRTVGSLATHCTPKQLKIARAVLQNVAKSDPTAVLQNYNLALSRPSTMINDQDINSFGNVTIPFAVVSEIVRSTTEAASSDDLLHLWFHLVFKSFISGNENRRKFVRQECIKIWNQNHHVQSRTLDYLKSSELSLQTLVLSSLISFLIRLPIGEDSSPIALLFVNNLLKALFGNKPHIPPLVLPLCTDVIKHLVDPEMFKAVVMSALHRAILRSAEANMVGAAAVLRSVSFDLDFCADELVQPMVTHLCALSDSIRRSTVNLLCAIISRCSELDAITTILKCIYAQITGPEGKKAGKDARLTGLTCLGELCNHGAKRATVSDAVGKTAVGLLVEFMEQETSFRQVREGDFVTKTKVFDTKTAPAVRCAYLACLDSAFTNVDIQDRLPPAVHASLLTIVERAVGQPNHSPVVSEAVCASLIWLRYFLAKAKRPLCHETIKSTAVWTLLLGTSTTTNRRPWFSERFLQTAPDYVLRKLANLMELILRELNLFIPDEVLSCVYRNLVLLAIHPHYGSVRKPASECIMSLIRKAPESDRWAFANRLLCDLSLCLAEGEEDSRFSKPIAETTGVGINKTVHKPITNTVETVGPRVWNEVATEHPDTNLPATKAERQRSRTVGSYVAKLVADLVRITSFCSDYCVDNERAAKKTSKNSSNVRKDLPVEYWRNVIGLYLASLLPASHTIVFTGIPTLWERLRRYIGLPKLADDPDWINFVGEDYLSSKWSELASYFANLSCLDQSHTVALRRLVSWSPLKFGQALFSLVFSRLHDRKFVHASERDVHIMLTPASQLYNQDLLESLPKYQKSDTNVKRESKLYSYDVQLDIMTAKKQREEMLKKSILPNERSLLDVLAEQLTDKQLESVRAELAKEAEIRQRMFQADMEARHLINLVTTALQTCALKSVCQSVESAPMVRELFNAICAPLSDLLVRLIASPLVAPYVLRTCVNGVTLAMLLCVNSANGIDLEDCQRFAPLIGWWSVRILGPARLLHQSDVAVLTPSFCSSGKRLSLAQRYVLEQMVDDATSLTAGWSEESIINQTGRVLGFLTEKRNKNTTLLYAFLCPTFEFLLLASGWAQPLLEELSSLPFPSLISEVQDIKQTDTYNIISPVVRKKWDWVTSQYVKDLLTDWLHQFQSSVPGPDSFVSVAHREVVLHVLPFQHVFRLMRQVVDGMLGDSNPYSVGLDQQLMSDQDNDAETRFLVNEESEDRSSVSKALAQTALDVMRSAANLLAYELSGENISDTLFCELSNGVLRSLLMGIVSETSQAREICLTCILVLIQKVPSFVEKVLKAQSEPSFIDIGNVDAGHVNVGCTPDLTGEADDALDLETMTEASTKNVAENKPKKKLKKNQRRKQKQAQMVADLLKEQGDGDMLSMPYETPAFWPSLPLWPTLQVRIWVARSDLSSEVAVLADRLWFLFGFDIACEQPVIEEENQESSLVRLRDTPTTPLMRPMVLAQRLLLETTRPVASVQKATADAFALCLMGRSEDELAVALGQLVHLYRVMLHRDPPVKDSVGRILVPESADRWRERVGLAFALARLPESPNLSVKTVRSLRKGLSAAKAEPIDVDRERPITTMTEVTHDSNSSDRDADRGNRADSWLLEMFRFLVPDGLNDRNPVVQSVMLQAGLNAVSIYGKVHLGQLLPILETFLNKAPNIAELDAVRQSVLILTGSLSQHLAADDPKVWNIFNRLITTLNFPSDVVQQAVEDCLASLVTKLSEEQKTKTIARLMSTLLGSPVYAERHGAAHGIAGIASGLGIMSLKHYGIIEKLIPALEDTKSSKRREGRSLPVCDFLFKVERYR
ncbi:hypothetical protein P879_08182 [Paragonimus westermani]|uniref:Stalled ribosome sensor GCN1-like N-terminal domain-containing protein n=1 Tax=Paragonimus westermani TaxID=34504 RepID=A0A8T0D869_9TREM|nr:hypothetical protein P879_08182 [Paragonimus westermani]